MGIQTQRSRAASVWTPLLTLVIGALAGAMAFSMGCGDTRRGSGGGDNDDDDAGSATGTGGSTGTGGAISYDEYCEKKTALETMCFPEIEHDSVEQCQTKGICLVAAMRPEALSPYINCQLDGCITKNCAVVVGNMLPDSDVQKSYEEACSALSSCDDSVDWYWCSDDFAWNILSDKFLSQLMPCFEEASCEAAQECLLEIRTAAFGKCQ